MWLLVVGFFFLRVFVFTFIFCLLKTETQSRSIFTQKQKEIQPSGTSKLGCYVAKREHFLSGHSGLSQALRSSDQSQGNICFIVQLTKLAIQRNSRLLNN